MSKTNGVHHKDVTHNLYLISQEERGASAKHTALLKWLMSNTNAVNQMNAIHALLMAPQDTLSPIAIPIAFQE